MNRSRASNTAQGFTKPPMLRVRVSVPRSVLIVLAAMVWASTTAGRLHPTLVAGVPVVVAIVAFTTIYHVAMTHWVVTGWAWMRRRRAVTAAATVQAQDAFVAGVAIGVVSEHETLSVLIELHSDPLAPTVATDTEERTANVLDVADLAYAALRVLDVDVCSLDLISDGHRAAGGFADLYQQLTGPTIAPAERRSWIVARIGLSDNMSAIDRRGTDGEAPQRVAAATCLRVADALASAGIDARPATAATIDAVNARLHAEQPNSDHWSYLESENSFTGVYYADPGHIGDDASQWWTWPVSREVTTLIRITPGANGNRPRIAALVRYRTQARPPAPPVSRLGPLYGVQSSMWQQFRVGHLPCDTPPPSAALPAEGPVVPFGPAGPLIGAIGDPRDHTAVYLPLVSPITVLCQNAVLLRQVTLRACVTGRPIVVVTDEPDKWQLILPMAVTGTILTRYPAEWDNVDRDGDDDAEALLDPETILVIDTDKEWPENLPPLTILTDDGACDADIELTETEDEFGFNLKFRTGLQARVRAVPAHEERRLLTGGEQPAAQRGGATPVKAGSVAGRPAGPTTGLGRTPGPAAKSATRGAVPPPPGTLAPGLAGPGRSMGPVRPNGPTPGTGPQSPEIGRQVGANRPVSRGPQAGAATPGAAPVQPRPAAPQAPPPRPIAPQGRPAPRPAPQDAPSARPPAPRGAPPQRPPAPPQQPARSAPPPRPAPPARSAPPPRPATPAPQGGPTQPPGPPQQPARSAPPPRPSMPAPQGAQPPRQGAAAQPPAPSSPQPRPAAPAPQPVASTPPPQGAPPRDEVRPPAPPAPSAESATPELRSRPPVPESSERDRHDWAAVAGRGSNGKHRSTDSDEGQRTGLRKRWRGRQLKSTPPAFEPDLPAPEPSTLETPEILPRRVAFNPLPHEEE